MEQRDLAWVAAKKGEVPKGAVVGGNNRSGDIFVARVECEGEIIPGKLIPGYGYCYVTSEGCEMKFRNYEVLCDENVDWEELEDVQGHFDIPRNAVYGGMDNEGNVMYIGRIRHGRSITVGKVDGRTGKCYVLFGGKEHCYNDYEILIYTKPTIRAVYRKTISNISKSMSTLGILNKNQSQGSRTASILTPPKPPSSTSSTSKSSTPKPGGSKGLVEGTQLIPVPTTDSKYKWISEKMKKDSTTTYNIVKIEQIWNSKTWKRYVHYRDNVIKLENNGEANEKRLFHGSKVCKDIVQKGFDERQSSQGGLFGAGVYFADKADKSNGYVGPGMNSQFQMLVCRVALGKVHEVASGSSKFSHAPPGFHSVKGSPLQHTEYIVYRGEQAFPGYLITYTR